ncbi:MAG: hypothetical protein EZS28_018152 [Streblomastix strix]|uniref:Uncharacterized protein n=1 Tax=Streblomastix strix TaxID=222440 RepID=A0A5J4VVM3_9EUKA|nr:MAG: hypothetical protein EZS28_018152 [Streblomastix strix]
MMIEIPKLRRNLQKGHLQNILITNMTINKKMFCMEAKVPFGQLRRPPFFGLWLKMAIFSTADNEKKITRLIIATTAPTICKTSL